MAVWKNIKCPGCGKPNERKELKARKGVCFYCGFKIVSNLSIFMNNGIKPVVIQT
jgi:DNA-directed RNA polymerase subunit RPC12/RpoP